MQNEYENENTQNEDSNSMTNLHIIHNNFSSTFGNQNFMLKPKFHKLFWEIFANHSEYIFNYFTLTELCLIRAVNKDFLTIIHEYYQKRLKMEIQIITNYQTINSEKNALFMEDIDSQIPISHKNWLDFDLNSVTNTIDSLSRKTITELRAIKNLGKFSDVIYAPFCIIFGYNKTTNPKVRADGWKKTAGKILNDANFFIKLTKLDFENLNDDDMLEAFVSLNLPELDINIIKRYSPAFSKLIQWCQAVVSYHILIHPYIYRNNKGQTKIGGEVYEFSQQMNFMINKFYKFKRFLFILGILKIPLGDCVFNLQHSREIQPEIVNYNNILTDNIIGNILSYLPIRERCKYITINNLFLQGFQRSLDITNLEVLKHIAYFKLETHEKLYQKLPILFENSIFSNYFLMLDDVLNSQCNLKEQGINYTPFLSKEQLNDIKKIKLDNELTNSITKVLCIILNEKPERKQNERGEIKTLYLKKIKLLAINGSLNRTMRNVNKLELEPEQIKVLTETMINFYSKDKLQQVKKINRGLYQLLIWELYVFEYIKLFNPFYFINLDEMETSGQFEQDEIQMIGYYLELINYLKFNLKAKFHFNNMNVGYNNYQGPNFDFKDLMNKLSDFLKIHEINIDTLSESSSQNKARISNVYFQSKDLIPQQAKPALYERIMIEIISTSVNGDLDGIGMDNSTKGNVDTNLGTIKEENSLINTNSKSKGKKFECILFSNINNPNTNQSNSNTETNLKQSESDQPLIEDIGNDIIINYILFYLDINSFANFSLVNKKFNKCLKTHVFIRLYVLNREIKFLEEENKEIIDEIQNKRKEFFSEYEIAPPNQEHALKLIGLITRNDILELKQVYKKYNKTNEKIIAPLVVLMGGKAKNGFDANGYRTASYFIPGQKMLYSKDFFKKLQQLEYETITTNQFSSAEELMQDPVFKEEKMKNLSPCLTRLISWLMGIIEFHRAVRQYSLSYYDIHILDQNELDFCIQMDNSLLSYYKMNRYAKTYCKKYERYAQELIKTIDTGNYYD